MKKPTSCFALIFAMTGFGFAQDADNSQKPVTISQALKLGEEKLTEYTGSSEVGQDQAAELYATAKRLTTEQRLGQEDLKAVLELDSWRDAISACRKSIISLAYVINGGGTMYSHGQRRDISAVEDFLATLSKDLPLPDGKGDPNADKVIDRTIALIKNVRVQEGGYKDQLAERAKSAIENFTNLKGMVDGIPAAHSKKIVTFATDGVSGWLFDDSEEGKKFEKFRAALKQ